MPSTTIVALPEADEAVWNLSSEKKPHLTLLYLDGALGSNEEEIINFVKHAADTSLSRFGLSVDRRGTLGEDDADVLFFDAEYGIKQLREFRANLLKNDEIAKRYVAADQFPGWIPHLTMGYPKAPAKESMEDQNYYLKWINFDRIAVWTSSYEGPEFDLKKYDMAEPADASWSEDRGVYIMHYGTKGMHWGVRKDNPSGGGTYVKPSGLINTGANTKAGRIDTSSRAGDNTKSLIKGTGLNILGPIGSAYISPIASRYADVSSVIKSQAVRLNQEYSKPGKNLAQNKKLQPAYDKAYQKMVEESFKNTSVKGLVLPSASAKIATKRIGDVNDLTFDFYINPGGKQKPYLKITSGNGKSEDLRLGKFDAPKVKHAEDDLPDLDIDLEVDLTRDSDGYITDFAIPDLDELKQSAIDIDSMSNDDWIAHYGRLGMKWGVRRSVGPNGLVKGTVAGAIKEGQTPRANSAPVTKGKQSADHKTMVKNAEKNLESLSTQEIRDITARIKAINDFKATTAAEKAKQASTGKKLADFALTSVKAGVAKKADSYIQELVGDTLEGVLPKTTSGKKRAEKERREAEDREMKIQDREEKRRKQAQKEADERSNKAPKAKENRDDAIKDLVYTITTLSDKED